MRPLKSLRNISDPYSRRILANIINQDPLKVMAGTVARIRKLARGLTEKQLRTPPARGKWSIVQIVTHLCDVELVLAFRIRMALAQAGSAFQAIDQDQWALRLAYQKASLPRKLELFTAVRNEHLALFRTLTPSEWKRFGIHEERGKETVERIVYLYAGHDINHLKQIEAIRDSFVKRKRK